MSDQLSDQARERELTEHNNRLADTLREARDQMIEMAAWTKDAARFEAIDDALVYVILAVDMRIAECKTAIARGTVGQESDRARNLAGSANAAIFETALRASGYQVIPIEAES